MNAGAPSANKRQCKRWRPSGPAGGVIIWALLMLPLLWWGLPSQLNDDLLFGGDEPWPAERYQADAALNELRTRAAGADTDLNPLDDDHRRIVNLTATEAQRAEILRRYRLYSRQPDEMIIFRALQRMRPGELDFDPRLYQYGGGYLYLVAGALAGAHVVGVVDLSADAGVFLTQPEQFGRFYVVARIISLVFGGLTLLAVSKLARRAAGKTAGWLALLCLAVSPSFIVAVVEAKPHLPAACMALWAALSGLDYRARGKRWDALRMGLQAGYACGLVVTGVVALLLWPAVLLVRRDARTWKDLGLAGLLAVGVYVVTNPYVPYNLLFNPEVFQSNIGNSTAMYVGQVARAHLGLLRVGELLWESLGPGLLVVGLVGLVLLTRGRPGGTWLVAAPGVGMLLIAALTGADKPAEFARFLVLPIALLATAAGVLLATLTRKRIVAGLVVLVIVVALVPTGAYVGALRSDARGRDETRRQAGFFIDERLAPGAAVGVLQEPAPYAVPPVDFRRHDVYLLPPRAPEDLRIDELPPLLVFTADAPDAHADAWWQEHYRQVARYPGADVRLSPITWANKLVLVYERS